MNKTDLIISASASLNADIKATRDAVNSFLRLLAHALVDGEDVLIQDLGTFRVKDTPARTGRNPATGEAITIPAGRRVSFKVSKALKEVMNHG